MKWAKQTKGFTIVELLIVIVVIGILAAIIVVSFNGIQQRARDVKRKDDVAQIGKALAIWGLDTGNTFENLNAGYNGVSATGWFSSNYAGSSVKSVLVSGKYLSDGVGDPLSGTAFGWDYMLTRCTNNATDNRRVVLAKFENPPSTSVTTQLQPSGCNDPNIASFISSSYGMNYALVVDGQ